MHIEKFNSIKEKFVIADEKLFALKQSITNKMKEGLLEGSSSSLKMIPTFVSKLPDKNKSGTFYGIDLGGTNLRIIKYILSNGVASPPAVFRREIPNSLLLGECNDLFDFVADFLVEVSKDETNTDGLRVGFTFSFPVDQKSLTSGTLICWTKGFDVKGVVGKDVCQLLREAVARVSPKTNVHSIALLNDTVGTLLCGAQKHDHVALGFIMGTGSNSCYIEQVSEIAKLADKTEKVMIINTESGNFGMPGDGLEDFLTPYDVELDKASIRPGAQVYEKCISGFYIDEIAKRFASDVMSDIDFKWMDASVLSSLNSDEMTNDQLKEKYSVVLTQEQFDLLKQICRLVCTRAARITACSLAAMADRVQQDEVVIAADGSVIQKNKFIKEQIEKCLAFLVKDKRVSIELVEDGSGTGAAILATTL